MLREQEILNALRALVDQWQSGSDKRTQAFLAKRSGLSTAMVHRLLTGESSLEVGKIIPVLEVVAEAEQRVGFLKQYYPEFANFIGTTYQVKQKKSEEDGVDFRAYMRQMAYFQVLTLFYTDNDAGVSKAKVSEEYGNNGIAVLSELIDKGIVYLHRDLCFLSESHDTADAKSLLHSVKNTCEFLAQGDSNYMVASHFGSLNKSGRIKLNDLTISYNKEASDILKTEAFKGDVPINVSCVVGILKPNATEKRS